MSLNAVKASQGRERVAHRDEAVDKGDALADSVVGGKQAHQCRGHVVSTAAEPFLSAVVASGHTLHGRRALRRSEGLLQVVLEMD